MLEHVGPVLVPFAVLFLLLLANALAFYLLAVRNEEPRRELTRLSVVNRMNSAWGATFPTAAGRINRPRSE